ncbi:epidermal growth factor receptor-like [Simochromis diagramma]|uniref:epidermal growth factor receptor-like n=1 Tax=Simochromis diagramma TaxID=43689 RepID=UPI001A7E2155|nr:epidermal growth factor receptor-like [Simochromis diagramma]
MTPSHRELQNNTMAARFLKWISITFLLWLSFCGLAENKVCQGVTNRLNLLGTKEDHYRNMVKTYSNCTVVLENLEITHMEDHRDLSFLRSIKEVGGYVLIALNTVSRIPLENLRIIRGHSLYDGSFALSVISNYNKSTNKGTDQILLTSLTEILKGGVKFLTNQLCNVETIQWSDILFVLQACRDFQDNGVCKDSCPGLHRYDPNLHQLVPNPHGKYSFGATCVKSCPRSYIISDYGACVRTCNDNTYEVEVGGIRKCAKCDGLCPEVGTAACLPHLCNGLGTGELVHTLSINATNIGSFENCTKINGNIDIIHTSIYGDQFTKIPKMDPAQLNVFKTVKEITGYLWIQTWPNTMSSLSPFENLEVVRGRTKRSRSLVVAGLHITHLGLRSLREISDGDVFVSKNSELCYTDAKHWQKLFKSPHQTVNIEGNANAATCALRNDTCDKKCTADGCWGPGPSMCISCRDYKRDGGCIDSCNILEGEPRETAVNKTCIKCHPECQHMNGTATCSAPGSANCTKCANFKDGLFCVSQA